MSGKFDKNFVERALRSGYKDETIEVIDYVVEDCCAKGANFLSDMYRTVVKLKRHSNGGNRNEDGHSYEVVSIVVKCEPSKDATALEIHKRQNLFETELRMYNEVIKEIEIITGERMGPKLLYASRDPKIIVMEDLKVRGYKTMNRQNGLPLLHNLLGIYKMAALHAGSVALCEKNPKLAKSFDGGILVNVPDSFLKLSEVSIINACSEMRGWSYEYKEYADKLERYGCMFRNAVETANVYRYEVDEFCVINHGDCWINNIMFKDEESSGEPGEVLLVDYQMSVYTSPAIDLHYFLNCCPDIKLKYEKQDYFLMVYVRTLGNIMGRIGCATKPPTLNDLKRSMYKRRLYAIFSGIVLYPRMVSDEIEDFDEALGRLGGNTMINVFKKEEAVVSLRKFVKYMKCYFD